MRGKSARERISPGKSRWSRMRGSAFTLENIRVVLISTSVWESFLGISLRVINLYGHGYGGNSRVYSVNVPGGLGMAAVEGSILRVAPQL